MANLPPSVNWRAPGRFEVGSSSSSASAAGSSSSSAAAAANRHEQRMRWLEQHVLQLSDPDLRENALFELSKHARELYQDLAPLLWNSFGTTTILLQELTSIYRVLSPLNLTQAQSNRVCHALALLECVASHPDTRRSFLSAQFPEYIYPFLETTCDSRPFECLRVTSLGVFSALAKADDIEVINYILSSKIILLCLRTMENGSQLSKTVATFIVQMILHHNVGLRYICTTADRFFGVTRLLQSMVSEMAEQPFPQLLKHIIGCYLRLTDNPRARYTLQSCLPDLLRDPTFTGCLRDDRTTNEWLQQLLRNVQGPPAGGAFGHMVHLII